jgi:hypothetical protein
MTDVTFQLDDFRVTARDIAAVEVDLLVALSVSVGWSHRAADWDFYRKIGEGRVAMDSTGRIHGAVMWFRYGAEHGTVGMLITTPRLQSNGGGRWLAGLALAALDGRVIGLLATRQSHRLWRAEGFIDQGKIVTHQGRVGHLAAVEASPKGTLRELLPSDRGALTTLDRVATGWDRAALLEELVARADGVVIERGGSVTGCALIRPFGRGQVIGPVIAETTPDALALARALLARNPGNFVRIDTRDGADALGRLARSAGLAATDRVTRMARGGLWPFSRDGAVQQFAIVAQATG